MKKLVLGVLVGLGLASTSPACACAIIESYGNLPDLKRYLPIAAGKVVEWRIGSTQDTLVLDIDRAWRGIPRKTVFIDLPKENTQLSNCYCSEPTLVWNFAKLEKGKDYVFLGYQNELYYPSAIPLEQAQGIFAELGAIALPESSNISKNGVNGVPLVCHIQSLSSPLYNLEDRESGLFWLAARYAAEGDRFNALKIANSIENAGLRANIALSLAATSKEENRFDEGLQIMEKQPTNQDIFLLTVICELVSTNHFDRAIQLVNRFKDATYRREALEFLGLKLVEAQKYDLAQQLVTDIPDYPHYYGQLKSSTGYVALRTVESYLKNGNYNRAMETALKIDNRFFRTRAMLAISRKYALERNFSKAIELANAIDFLPSQYSGFTFYYTSDSLNYEAKNKIEILFQIASLAVKSGDRDIALQIADRENNSQLSSNILMAIALQHFKDGNSTLGDEFLKRSLETSESFDRIRLAYQAIASGLVDKVLSMKAYFSDEKDVYGNSPRLQVLFEIVKNLRSQGKHEEALRITLDPAWKYDEERSQLAIVYQLIEQDRDDDALKLIYSLKERSAHDRLQMILGISTKYSRSGNTKKSRQYIQTALEFTAQQYKESNSEPSFEYLLIAEHAQSLGLNDLALEVAQKISVARRADTLQTLADYYIKVGDDRRAFKMLEQIDKGVSDRPDQIKALQSQQRDRRNSFFLKLVERAIAAKKYDVALEYADKMTDKFENDYHRSVYSSVSSNQQKAALLAEIAFQLAKSGAFDRAIEATVKIRDLKNRDRIWEVIASEQSNRGNYREGIAIANRIHDLTIRSKLSKLLTCADSSLSNP